MQTSFLDSRMAGSLGEHFPSLCTIQEETTGTDAYGQPNRTWASLAGHIDIPCSVQLMTGRLQQGKTQEIGATTHRISLAGGYPTIDRTHRAMVGGVTYQIVYCSPAGFSNSVTFLECNLFKGGT